MSPNFCFVLVLAVLSASNVKGKRTSEERLIRLIQENENDKDRLKILCAEYVRDQALAFRRQGVLKLTFNNSTRKRAEIFMRFSNSTDWSFNVGDSRTNNGWGGDAATQDSDAEVHSRSRTILFYGKGIQGSQWYGHLYSGQDFIDDAVTLNVADELAVANNGNDLLYFNTYKTFALNGQADSEGPVNYDVYLGMNRVVAGSYRSASAHI
nr:hypothetical protein BaRGS_028334 [Batillaria attramentaria]